MSKYKGELGLLFVTIIWGTGFPLTAVALESFGAFQLVAIRCFLAALMLSVIFYNRFKLINKESIKYGVCLGIFMFWGFTLQTIGLKYTLPSKSAFLTASNVVIVPFIGFLLFRRKLDIYGIIGAILAIIGVGVLTITSNFYIEFGDLLTIFCAVFCACHIFFTKEFLSKGADPSVLSVIQMITGTVLTLFGILITKEPVNFNVSLPVTLVVLYLGFGIGVTTLLQSISQRYINETKAAIIMSMESVFGTIFSIIILNEAITLKLFIGSILILLGILLSEVKFDIKQVLMSIAKINK